MTRTNKLVLFTLLFCSNSLVYPQTSNNSPYTYFGLGNIETSIGGRTSGMGGVGIALNSSGYINQQNPASYRGIDSLFFLFDINLNGYKSYLESKQSEYNVVSGNVNKIAIGFRLSPRVAFSAGIMPYSSVGYKINTTKWVEGTTDKFDILSTGEGGLNKIYFGGSYLLNKHNSIGVNASVLFGSITKTEEYTYSSLSSSWSVTEKFVPKSHFYFDFGYQYSNSINKKYFYKVGLIGGVKTKMRFSKNVERSSEATSEEEDLSDTYNFRIPAYLGIGLSVSTEKTTIATDFTLQKWSNVSNNNLDLTDSYKWATGFEYSPNKQLGKNIFQRMSYQVGFHVDKSYLNINNVNLYGYGITAGVVIPIKNQFSSICLSFETGQKGYYSEDLFRERYYQFNLAINMNDIWFMKRKYK